MLQSFDTLTGLKFFITADPYSRHLDAVLKEVYVLYSDYVLKNPFYEVSLPQPRVLPPARALAAWYEWLCGSARGV